LEIGLLILRIVVGGIFIGHGTQKLFGWFGGPGPARFGANLEKIGYRPGTAMAVLAGTAETTGGTLLVLGLLTPVGAAAVIGMMLSATLAVHWPNGFWNSDGGFEFPLALAAAATALAFAGPGRYSLDHALGIDLSGVVYGIDAVVFGVAVGLILYGWRNVQSRQQEEVPEAPRRAA
jgi:putative oxidoreductase